MEWVETTGRTVEEASDAALEQLGVAEEDAEIQVLAQPKPGLFGRLRGEARVRARVRPAPVRPKEDRRDRRRRRSGSGSGDSGGSGPGGRDAGAGRGSVVAAEDASGSDAGARGARDLDTDPPGADGGQAPRRRSRGGRGGARANSEVRDVPEGSEDGDMEGNSVTEDVALEEQATEAVAFLNGLIDRLDLDAEVESELLDDETAEVRVNGNDLGILIGPRGDTLAAIQELTRTVVQRRLGAHNGRLLVDIASYRQKRRVALERFTQEVADQVKSTGQRRVLEPMPPADRKVVHDTVNGIDGLSTTSEGEEPRRRVVIMPQS